MKQNNKIRNYYYNKEQEIYTIEIDGGVNININLIRDSDARRYGISDPTY